jgi:hypothetical protein
MLNVHQFHDLARENRTSHQIQNLFVNEKEKISGGELLTTCFHGKKIPNFEFSQII